MGLCGVYKYLSEYWRDTVMEYEQRERAAAVFDPAITLPDPYDDRPGPYYDMRRVREIERIVGLRFEEIRKMNALNTKLNPEAYAAVLKAVRAAWTLVDNTAYDEAPRVDMQDWKALAESLSAMASLIPATEQPAEPPHAVVLLWPDDSSSASALLVLRDMLPVIEREAQAVEQDISDDHVLMRIGDHRLRMGHLRELAGGARYD